MSETTAETTETTTETTTTETAPSWEEAFKGEDPAKVRKALEHAREWEKRAKTNADAAKRLSEIEDAQKTEAEKAADRVAKAEAEAASVPAKVAEGLREALITLGVLPEDKKVLLTAADPALLIEQVRAIQGLVSDTRRNGNVVPREGNNPTSTGEQGDAAFARALFSGE